MNYRQTYETWKSEIKADNLQAELERIQEDETLLIEKKRIEQVLANEKFRSIITELGIGFEKNFRIDSSTLMGEVVEPRKNYITQYANFNKKDKFKGNIEAVVKE